MALLLLGTILAAAVSAVALWFVSRWELVDVLDPRVSVQTTLTAFEAADPDAVLKDLFEAERVRTASTAKGVATTAAGLIAAVIPALLKGQVKLAAPFVVIIVAGAAALLIMTARSSTRARLLTDELVFAFALRRKMPGQS